MKAICDPCHNGQHSRCAGEPVPHLMCSCHWCKKWADSHGPFSIPEDTKPEGGIVNDKELADWLDNFGYLLRHERMGEAAARLRELTAEVENLSITAEAALREVERLRAAGNEMMKHVAAVVEYDRIGPTYTSHPAVVAWRAALGEES